MSRLRLLIAASMTLGLPSCSIHMDDAPAGPVRSESRSVDRGSAELVRAVIRMGAGELKMNGGAAKLVEADFRTSFGIPTVEYKVTGARGILEIENKTKKFRLGGGDNSWRLRFDNETPLDIEVHLGAGESDLDFAALNLRSVEVHMGVGEVRLNLDGDYKRDVDVEVHGGVGAAVIRLPRKMGAQVDAKGGIGAVKAKGLKKDGGKYVNAAYETSTRQVRCQVRGGVGEITLIGDE